MHKTGPFSTGGVIKLDVKGRECGNTVQRRYLLM